MAETLWPDASPKQAIDSLYKALRHIRSLSLEIPVKQSRGSLWLDMSAISLDLEEFIHCYKSSETRDWERAIDLYKDILLIGNTFEWAYMYEALYDTYYYDLLLRLSRHYEALGNSALTDYYRNKYEQERI